jgi:hypothetical protein
MSTEYIFANIWPTGIGIWQAEIYRPDGWAKRGFLSPTFESAETGVLKAFKENGLCLTRCECDLTVRGMVHYWGESVAVEKAARQPRQARVENLGSALVGWWVDRPDEKCESLGVSEAGVWVVLFQLAALIKVDPITFRDGVVNDHGWKRENLTPTCILITEVLPEHVPGAVKCARCEGRGRYVGFTSVEDACGACGGSGEVAR